jgi:hypothetical protein
VVRVIDGIAIEDSRSWIVMFESVDMEKRSLAYGCHSMVENFPTCESNLDASSAMISPLSLELTCSTLIYNYLRLKRDRTPFDETTPRSPG